MVLVGAGVRMHSLYAPPKTILLRELRTLLTLDLKTPSQELGLTPVIDLNYMFTNQTSIDRAYCSLATILAFFY